MSVGLLCSLAVHAALVALILWPSLKNTLAAPMRAALIVDLVEGPTSGADGAELAEAPAAPAPAAAVAAAARRSDAAPVSTGVKGAEAPPQPPKGPEVAATVGDLLRGAEAAHGGAAAQVADNGSGVFDVTDAGGTGATSLKDFIRVQIERRWQIDANAPDALVTLRLLIGSDGSVLLAEPMTDGDKAYRALAIAARNAALLSSPLQFPRGTFAVTGEMIIDLNTRDTRR
jgi:membrane protein involved in colicin uptake